MFLSVEIFNGP